MSDSPTPVRHSDEYQERTLIDSDSQNEIETLDAEGRPRKQSDILLDIGRTHKLFRDPSGTPYAQVKINGHLEVHLVDSRAYREVLLENYLRIVGKGCNKNAINDALSTISSLARFKGETHPVSVRVAAGINGSIVIDMGRQDWRCIKVDAQGWRNIDYPPMC